MPEPATEGQVAHNLSRTVLLNGCVLYCMGTLAVFAGDPVTEPYFFVSGLVVFLGGLLLMVGANARMRDGYSRRLFSRISSGYQFPPTEPWSNGDVTRETYQPAGGDD